MKVLELLGFPHAGNDVFSCLIEYNGEKKVAILKIERQVDANLENEIRMIRILKNKGVKLPDVITHGKVNGKKYIATSYNDGKRLSQILSEFKGEEIVKESLKHMKRFGENLGKIHTLDVLEKKIEYRKFHSPISVERSIELGLNKFSDWLHNNKPGNGIEYCFVHGDHHYANILWKDYKITSTLDWELSGTGWKEFDIAWALIIRPSQRFLKSEIEREKFLKGYSLHSTYNKKQLTYCMVMIYQYFYEIGYQMGDNEYNSMVKRELNRLVTGGYV